jgi:hypothetical protein
LTRGRESLAETQRAFFARRAVKRCRAKNDWHTNGVDPYEQLDLPPSTRQLPPHEQRELLTDRYLQLLERTETNADQLALQNAWQFAMQRAQEATPVANTDLGAWVENGFGLVKDLGLEASVERPPAPNGGPRPALPATAPTLVYDEPHENGVVVPCPVGHEHVYDDERGGQVMLKCPSCRALFSAIINTVARDVHRQQALSFREQEWSVTCIDPETSVDTVDLSFRGATTIDIEIGDAFSMVSTAGARGDHPLWLVNHSKQTRWALSGRGSGIGFFQRQQPKPVRAESIALIGYALPAVAVWGLASLALVWWCAAVVGVLAAVFLWRPFVLPLLLPIGERGAFERPRSKNAAARQGR